MSENAALRQCPRCTRGDCQHDELVIANALRDVGSGMGNIDVAATYTWVGSKRRHGRIAFVELKRTGEHMQKGQALAMFHATGTLRTAAGMTFDQRAFALRQSDRAARWCVTTWQADWDAPEVLALEATPQQAALVIGGWLETGRLA